MKIVRSIPEMMKLSNAYRCEGKTLGFVPTMGALHEGHLSLVRAAGAENQVIVVSIFVNPTQFGPNDDFEKYPRDLESDATLLEECGCHVVLALDKVEMYPPGYRTYVETEDWPDRLCGASRPGHFRGVTTVVSKLFHIVHPHKAYFGWKDAQQVLVIKQMVKDLNFDLEVCARPTIRDKDGLALSSRNRYLTGEEKNKAVLIPKAIDKAKEYFQKGGRSAKILLGELFAHFDGVDHVAVDYISLVDIENLTDVKEISNTTMLALAVRVGTTRLIDNHLFT
jgi:pantoate--beta-alanine ligase